MKQDIHELSAIKRYPIGFGYPITNPLDLRRFHYAKAGGTLNPDFGAKNVLRQHIAYTTIHTDAPALAVLVSIDVGAGDGVLGNGAIAADELAGGNIVIYPHSQNTINRMIVANTATIAGGGVMVVTIDKPLPCPLTHTTMHAECIANPYLKVQTGHLAYASVVGMPTMPATLALPFVWLQTWGPLWVNPQGHEGIGANNREVVFREDGSIDFHDPTDVTTKYGQHAGFVINDTTIGGQGAPFIFLQITP